MHHRMYLLLFFIGLNSSLFCQNDTLQSSRVYFYHQNQITRHFKIPLSGTFILNGERILLDFNSFQIKQYPFGTDLEVETKKLFKRQKKSFSLASQKNYYFKCSPVMTWWGKGNFKLTLVDDFIGQKAIKELKGND